MRLQLFCRAMIVLAGILAGCAPRELYRSRLIRADASDAPNVSATWLGTAGFLISDGQTDLLIDPFVSRQSLGRVGLGLPLHSDPALIREWLARLGHLDVPAVLVSHSHFDHVLDAPYFARETGALLVGSASTLDVGRGAGLPETQLRAITPGQPLQFGAFTVRFLESQHGTALFGRIPYPGTIEAPLVPPQEASAYRLGGVYAILIEHPAGTLLHHGSAGFLPGMHDGITADVVMMGLAGRDDTATYLAEVAGKVRPRLVIPIHFDDFFTPLDEEIDFLRSADFEEFCATADRQAASYRVVTIPLGVSVPILP